MRWTLGVLAALGACDGPNYGECEQEQIDQLPTFVAPAEGAFPQVGEYLFCANRPDNEEECLACDTKCFEVTSDSFKDKYSGDVSGYLLYTECGPMWLEDQCCWHVQVDTWYDNSGSDGGDTGP